MIMCSGWRWFGLSNEVDAEKRGRRCEREGSSRRESLGTGAKRRGPLSSPVDPLPARLKLRPLSPTLPSPHPLRSFDRLVTFSRPPQKTHIAAMMLATRKAALCAKPVSRRTAVVVKASEQKVRQGLSAAGSTPNKVVWGDRTRAPSPSRAGRRAERASDGRKKERRRAVPLSLSPAPTPCPRTRPDHRRAGRRCENPRRGRARSAPGKPSWRPVPPGAPAPSARARDSPARFFFPALSDARRTRSPAGRERRGGGAGGWA